MSKNRFDASGTWLHSCPMFENGNVRTPNEFDRCPHCAKSRLVSEKTRPSWDEHFLAIAKTVSLRADCTRRQVGCVIRLEDNTQHTAGYNGGPSKGPSCLEGECPRGRLSHEELAPDSPYDGEVGKCVALHAEWNALLRADFKQLPGATMYITDEPCHICRLFISGTPIVRVVWPDGEYDNRPQFTYVKGEFDRS